MGRYADVVARNPPGTFVIPLSAFADTWEDRPTSPICVGLRTVAAKDLRTARAQAFETARRCHPDVSPTDGEMFGPWIEAYNDALMAWIIARGTCDPNDVNLPPEIWAAGPEDMVPTSLSADGKKLIFDRWEIMCKAVDPTDREAGDEEILGTLPTLLRYADKLSPARRSRARRLLAFVIDELAPFAPPPANATNESDADSAAA